MLLGLRLPNQITRFAPGPNTFQCNCFTFMTTLKRGSSQLRMSRLNISLSIFLQNLCPMIYTCAYAIKSWGGCQLHLLTKRECEVIAGPSLKCLPTSVPVLPILLRAILYFLQYMESFSPIVCLFYLTPFSILYIFISNIQPGSPTYLWCLNPPHYTTKFSIDNLALIIFRNYISQCALNIFLQWRSLQISTQNPYHGIKLMCM